MITYRKLDSSKLSKDRLRVEDSNSTHYIVRAWNFRDKFWFGSSWSMTKKKFEANYTLENESNKLSHFEEASK
ncbi:hypothetical protein PP939_gp157 [Rhizobium phage RL38J1]|uniref:Uncharacterized protein n=1 Tax=Rhizobium phage RL38J1 TaxID=2663232 RepID=A0A6B9J719_9CAUD|nr:hypothetical protein PP939_gp157 [Rhizobium phage RL38J1]QGZ14051.1 hypothetical protein RL38J1_157 [Rhizobium phage RL38J1]